MSAVQIKSFGGENHVLGERLLQPGMATTASNVKPFSYDLRGWFLPKFVVTATKAAAGLVQSIWRMNNGGADYWLNWLTDVDVAKSPIPGDTTQRIYWTGDGEPRESNFALATSGADLPTQWYVTGVVQPTPTPTTTHSGGTGAAQSRAYLYTIVTTFGEEGMPSAAGTATGKVDDTWGVSGMETIVPNGGTISAASVGVGYVDVTLDTTTYMRVGEELVFDNVAGMTDLNGTWAIVSFPGANQVRVALSTAQTYSAAVDTWTRKAPHNTTGMFKRLYRADLAGTYRLVTDNIPLANATATDAVTDANLPLQAALTSTFFAMPPTNLKALTSGWNGMIFGISGNMVCVCEPYQPHAWPTAYQYPLAWNGVALGVAGTQMLVIGTEGNPYVAIGTFSDSLSFDPVPLFEPCVAKRSMTSLMDGVRYSSNNGLIRVGPFGSSIISQPVASKDQWSQYTPSLLIASVWQQKYIAVLKTASADQSGAKIAGLYFDLGAQGNPTLFDLSDAFLATEAWTDPQSGKLYVVVNGTICEWDRDTLNYASFDWTSGIFQHSKPINMGVAKVDADYTLLQDTVTQAAQAAADKVYNTAIGALPETWPKQSKTKGCVNESMVNEMQVNGSLLRGGSYVFVPRYLTYLLYATDDTGTPVLRFSKSLMDNNPFRMPGGYLSAETQHRLAGNLPTFRLRAAETMDELTRMQ